MREHRLLAMLGQSSHSFLPSSVSENAAAGHGVVANDHSRFVRAPTFMATMINADKRASGRRSIRTAGNL
jgi:hypothetical protein